MYTSFCLAQGNSRRKAKLRRRRTWEEEGRNKWDEDKTVSSLHCSPRAFSLSFLRKKVLIFVFPLWQSLFPVWQSVATQHQNHPLETHIRTSRIGLGPNGKSGRGKICSRFYLLSPNQIRNLMLIPSAAAVAAMIISIAPLFRRYRKFSHRQWCLSQERT